MNAARVEPFFVVPEPDKGDLVSNKILEKAGVVEPTQNLTPQNETADLTKEETKKGFQRFADFIKAKTKPTPDLRLVLAEERLKKIRAYKRLDEVQGRINARGFNLKKIA